MLGGYFIAKLSVGPRYLVFSPDASPSSHKAVKFYITSFVDNLNYSLALFMQTLPVLSPLVPSLIY